jgi:NADH-quinone oxidoreductase subunit F
VPILLPHQLDIEASFDGVPKAGSLLGSAGIIVLDDTTCMVWLAENLLRFYRHESCGKCTPCREGTWWLTQTMARLEKGQGDEGDLDLLLDQCDNILGRSFCALGDGATSPISSSIQHFRDEYLAHLTHGGCPFDPAASTAFAPVGAPA